MDGIDEFQPLRAQLPNAPGVAHAFFTRQGGVSRGVYGSLNGGVRSNDDPAAVAENKRRMAVTLGVAPAHISSCPTKIHSADVLIVDRTVRRASCPRAPMLLSDERLAASRCARRHRAPTAYRCSPMRRRASSPPPMPAGKAR